MIVPNILPEWRTLTVVALCQSMRETEDYSALPILADALQDADCTDAQLLTKLRGSLQLVEAEALTACVFSEKTADSVQWLDDFCDGNDCPSYEMSVNAAADRHAENDDGWTSTEHWGEHIQINGSSAGAAIPPEFWQHLETVTGKSVNRRPRSFSCSC